MSINKNRVEITDAKPCPTGKGSSVGYKLEARYNYTTPTEIAGILLDNRWQTISFNKGQRGIPLEKFRGPGLEHASLLTRTEAEGFRWYFICTANAGDNFRALCLETRLVEVSVSYEFSAKPIAYVDAFDGRGDLPDDMAEKDAGK